MPIHHQIFNKENLNNPRVRDYIHSDRFTPEEYINALTNQYSSGTNEETLNIDPDETIGGYDGDYSSSSLKMTKHNIPENNQKILDYWLGQHNSEIPNTNQRNQIKGKLQRIFKYLHLPASTISDVINDPSKYGIKERNIYSSRIDDLKDQRLLSQKHLYNILEKHPDQIHGFMSHPAFSNDLFKKTLTNPEAISKIPASQLATVTNNALNQDQIQSLLDHGEFGNSTHTIHDLLNRLPEDKRKEHIDKVLGITGGAGRNNFGDLYDEDTPENRKKFNDEDNWQNWIPGNNEYRNEIPLLAQYNKLDENQIEHIKRHGNLSAKWELYNNKHIDPKHGAEMYKKWFNDDSDHGYDQEEFNKKIRKENEDDKRDSFYDEAREKVQEENPISDYLRYNSDLINKGDIENRYDDEIKKDLKNNYDWKGPNPDHNPTLLQKWNNLRQDKEGGNLFTSKGNRVNYNDLHNAGYTEREINDLPYVFDKNDPETDAPIDDLVAHHDQYGPEIDFSNHNEHEIGDHPDYEDREEEILDKYKQKMINDGDLPDSIYQNYDESLDDDDVRDKQEELLDDHFRNAHENEDYIPEHLHEHIPQIAELQRQKREKAEEAAREKALEEQKRLSSYLQKNLPYHENEHEYGEGLHHHEMVKDYADANGGSIDVGTMHKIFPNLKDTWKKIFGSKGKMTSEEIQGKIDAIPKTKYNVSYGDWKGHNMQNINGQDQVVFRLDHSPDSVKELEKDPAVHDTFKKVQEASKRSGHPTNLNTIGWARVDTSDPKNWMVDEVQSDFGSTARNYLEREGATEKAAQIQKIMDIHKDWRENIMNHVIKMAKKNGAESISTHSPQSKAQHTGAGKEHTVYKDSYEKIPRKMGFKPSTIDLLPLTEKGKTVFSSVAKPTGDASERVKNHLEAYKHHRQEALGHQTARTGLNLFTQASGDDLTSHELQSQHENLARQHMNIATNLDPTSRVKFHNVDQQDLVQSSGENAKEEVKNSQITPHKYDEELKKPIVRAEVGGNVGHTLSLKPQFFKKSIDIATDLLKAESLYIVSKQQGYDTSKLLNLIVKIREQLR